MYSHHTLYRELIAANPYFVPGISRHTRKQGGADIYRSCLITRLPMHRAVRAMAMRW
jgi:hypothetical protein